MGEVPLTLLISSSKNRFQQDRPPSLIPVHTPDSIMPLWFQIGRKPSFRSMINRVQERKPTMLGIGAAKAGTSWLTKQLRNHPEVWMTPIKELHFFDRSPDYPSSNKLATPSPFFRTFGSQPWERQQMVQNTKIVARHLKARRLRAALWWSKWSFGYYNESWYQRLFSQAKPYQVCGEFTPAYSILQGDDVAQIRAVNPEIKLIYMIRNPIDRTWSAIRYDAHKGNESIDLTSRHKTIEALQSRGILVRGDYERTLDTYLGYFDSSQILVCFYDAIQSDPIGLMSEVTRFLGISSFKESDIENQNFVNTSPQQEMPKKVEDYLAETYAPMIKRLAARIGSYATNWEESINSCAGTKEKVDPNVQCPPAVHP